MSRLTRTTRRFLAEGTDAAAALAFHGMLALLPALLVCVAAFGIIGTPETVTSLVERLEGVVPGDVASVIGLTLDQVVESRGGAAALLSFGLLLSLWSAQNGVMALFRALGRVFALRETRGMLRVRALAVGVTLASLVVALLTAVLLVAGGPLSGAVGDAVGRPDLVRALWWSLVWPVVATALAGVILLCLWAGPDWGAKGRPAGLWRGAALGAGLLLVASGLFSLYVGTLGDYGAAYGALGTAITLLVWLYVTAAGVLAAAVWTAEGRPARITAGPTVRAEGS